MKAANFLPLLWVIFATGCASTPLMLTPRVAPAVTGGNLDFPVRQFSAGVNKDVLVVDVKARRADGDYKNNLDLELDAASKVCANLAKCDALYECAWTKMTLRLYNEYGDMLRWRNTVGFIWVSLSREQLQMLGKQHTPASAYPRHWQFRGGSKAGPDLQRPREWPPGAFQ